MGRGSIAIDRCSWAAARGSTPRAALRWGLVLAALACGDSSTEPEAGAVGRIELAPAEQQIPIGESRPITLTVYDAGGSAVETPSGAFWSSSDPAVADVSQDGMVTAAALGEVQIAASVVGKSATAKVTVVPVPVARVEVSPSSLQLRVGQSGTLSARTLSAGDADLGRAVSWSSGDTDIATVDNAGRVTARGAGTTQITATSEGITGSATVTVSEAALASLHVTPSDPRVGVGQSVTLTAVLMDERGQEVTGRSIAWSTANAEIATVTADGRVSGVSPGTTAIRATANGVTGEAGVTVTPGPARTMTVSPPTPSVAVGGTVNLTATLRDAAGNVVTGESINWRSQSTSIATVNGIGQVRGVAPGVAIIVASNDGVSGSAVVTVTAQPVASVTVSPSTVELFPLQTHDLTATLRAADGSELTGRAVQWGSSNEAVATVSSSGRVTAILPGQATITAESEGQSGAATVTVRMVPVASVSVSLSPTSVEVGKDAVATATPRDAAGNALSGRSVQWSTSDGNVATVTQGGVVTGAGAGTAQIRATSEGVTGEATITVTSPAPVLVPARIEQVSLPESAEEGDNVSLVVRVLTASDQPVPGIRVRFVAGQRSGSFPTEEATTGADGQVQVSWRLNGNLDDTARATVTLPDHGSVPALEVSIEVDD
jgi:uncharacterized protein YjdB